MFAKGDRDHSSLRQGSNTKNQDHSWQSLPTVALSARLRYVRVRWWRLPSLEALVGVFGIISNGRRQFQRSTSWKSPHKLELVLQTLNKKWEGMNETDVFVPQPLGGLGQKKTGKDSHKRSSVCMQQAQRHSSLGGTAAH